MLRLQFADMMGTGKPVHHRHVQIHQHQVQLPILSVKTVDPLLAIFRDDDVRNAQPLQLAFGDHLIDRVIFHNQNTQARNGFHCHRLGDNRDCPRHIASQ